ncbi:MAG: hypothetical protein K6B69_13535 [Lachnospiraceae bacterium]|nr:hypothetical protein [Lachnospiraceae bacterium]
MDAVEFIVWIVPIGIPFFVISSVVLYIKNRIEAKETGQEINKIYKKLFSISIAIIVLFVVGILGMAIYVYPWMQKSKCSSDTQLADAVHTAILTAMMDPEIKKKEEYPEDPGNRLRAGAGSGGDRRNQKLGDRRSDHYPVKSSK